MWRGVACLFVVLSHCTVYTVKYANPAHPLEHLANHLIDLLRWMVIGVPMFFVISGYCITAAAFSAQSRSNSFRTFMTRRVRRIYPPYLILLGVVALVVAGTWAAGFPELFSDDNFPIPHPRSLSWTQWLGNLTLTETWRAHVFGDAKNLYMGHIWTLCYEEQFYLLTALILLAIPRRIGWGVIAVTAFTGLVLALAMVRGGKWPIKGFFFDGSWFMFAEGAAIYFFIHRSNRLLKTAILASLGLAMIAVTVLFPQRLSGYYTHLFEAPFFALLLIAIYRYDQAILATWPGKFCAWAGGMCYSLYLVHLPVTKACAHLLAMGGFHTGWTALALALPIGTALSLLAGVIFFRLVERHYLNAPLRVRESPPAAASPPADEDSGSQDVLPRAAVADALNPGAP